MAYAPDPRLDVAKAVPIMDVIERLGLSQTLRRAGREWVGPCPRPGCGGRDRFSVNPDKGVFHCRACRGDGHGADPIGLVRMVLGLTFPEALKWLAGDRDLTPAQIERARVDREKRAKEQAAAQARADRLAIERARRIWAEGVDPNGTAVSGYLMRRGIPAALARALPDAIRYHPDLPYMAECGDGRFRVIYHGPAMLAACVQPGGDLTAVHRTWLDLSEPKGKLALDPRDFAQHGIAENAALPAKKLAGRKARCAIRLSDVFRAKTLVMGEGIETTLTAMAAGVIQRGAFWAGIDLGHMSGRRIAEDGDLRYSARPDMTDDAAFFPPPWIERMIVIRDGDSEPRETKAKLTACLARARAKYPGLITSMIDPGDGVDLNDLAMRGQG